MPALLGFGFRPQLGYFDGTTLSVNGNEGQITRVGVTAPTR